MEVSPYTHYPSILHVLQDRLISMNSIPMLRCEAHYIVDSDSIIVMIGRQLCSISNKRHVVHIRSGDALPAWFPALSIQMASVDVEESNCVIAANSNELVTKGSVI